MKAEKVGMQNCGENNVDSIFDAKGIIHHEFVLKKQTVNGKFWKLVIRKLLVRVHHVRPVFQESGSRYFLHYNASAHSSGVVS
jgi:hypothetical protein